MAIQTRFYVEKGPGNNQLQRYVDPTVSAVERFRSPVVNLQYDDTVPSIVQNLDDYMDSLGYDNLSGTLNTDLFARPGNPGAVVGRSILYAKTALGVTDAFLRSSDGLVTQLTPPIRGNIYGLVAAWTSVSTVTIGIGACRDKTDSFTIRTTAPIVANIAVAGAGGLDTGAEAASTFYSIFVIADSTGVLPPNSLLSTGGDTPTLLPAGYDIWRRVGYVRNNPSSDFREFVTYGQGAERSIQYRDALSSRQQLTGGAATIVTQVNCGSLIPNSAVFGRFQIAQRGTVGASFYDDPTQLLANAQRSLLAGNTACDVEMRVSASQRVAYANAAAGGLVDVWVLGYEEQL
jgi:hypothetical protein